MTLGLAFSSDDRLFSQVDLSRLNGPSTLRPKSSSNGLKPRDCTGIYMYVKGSMEDNRPMSLQICPKVLGSSTSSFGENVHMTHLFMADTHLCVRVRCYILSESNSLPLTYSQSLDLKEFLDRNQNDRKQLTGL